MCEKKSCTGGKNEQQNEGEVGHWNSSAQGGAEDGRGQKWDRTLRGTRREPCAFSALSVSFVSVGQ